MNQGFVIKFGMKQIFCKIFYTISEQTLPSILDERNGVLFAIFGNEMNFNSAVTSCKNVKGTLPFINSEPVMNAIGYYHSECSTSYHCIALNELVLGKEK